MGALSAIQETAERLTGLSVQPLSEVHRLQETEQELRGKNRELQDLAYTILDYTQGAPQELRAQERRNLAQRARVVWQQDPQYGGTINLLNEFVLGRGISKPQAADDAVQDEIDDFWCHDDQTEALTEDGWMDLSELRRRWDDGTLPRVAGFDGAAGRIAFEVPKAMNVTPYDGSLLYGTATTAKGRAGRGVDFAVTPNHRMLTRATALGTGEWVKRKAHELRSQEYLPVAAPTASGIRIETFVMPGCLVRERSASRAGCLGASVEVEWEKHSHQPLTLPMDAWVEWLGWFISEGDSSRPCVYQTTDNPRLGAMMRACAALGVEGVTRTRRHRDDWSDCLDWQPKPAKQFREWLKINVGMRASDKRVPAFVFALAPEQMELMLDGLMGGDGTPTDWRDKGCGVYTTTSKQLADDVQRLATLCGWRGTVGLVKRSTPRPNDSPCWEVTLSRRTTKIIKRTNCEWRSYKGDVWCFSMPSGTMVTRRGGTTLISGNTAPDNQRVLTTHSAQVRLNTDLSLQSNVFPLVYDEGEDAKVLLGLLDHDTVENAVRDPDARLRILYYFTKSYNRVWSVEKHAYVVGKDRSFIRYYEEFRNLKDAEEDRANGVRQEDLPEIPDELIGRGRVLHVAINRTMEQAFGVPEIARTIKWLRAYNDLMRARVDMAKAAASIIMRRKLKGGAAAMTQLASQALLQAGATPQSPIDPMALGQAPRPGSVVEENDFVQHEAFNLNSGSQGAMQDAQMIRSQYSVGTGWPLSYLGDPSALNLSTATSLELKVLKLVEARQQVLEDLITTLVNHKIRRALETRKLSKWRPMTAEEIKRAAENESMEGQPDGAEAGKAAGGAGTRALHLIGGTVAEDEEEPPAGMVERDFTFQVLMPSPLRRAMGDLLTGVNVVAKTFDPNCSNIELSRMLLGIALGEGFEVEDPGAAVDRIFPPGYVDPIVAAAQAQAQQPPEMPPGSFSPEDEAGFGSPAPGFGATGADGQFHPSNNPYGARQSAQDPALSMQQSALVERLANKRRVLLHARGGDPLSLEVQEAVMQSVLSRVAPTPAGRVAGEELGVARGAQAEVLADGILGPAMVRALATVAASQ